MTDPVKRPAPIRERWFGGARIEKPFVFEFYSMWLAWREPAGLRAFNSFDDAIQFATDDREIGACS